MKSKTIEMKMTAIYCSISYEYCKITPCLRTPAGAAQLTGENVKTSKMFGVRPRNKFFTGETMKPSGGDTKIQRGELTSILRRLKNKDPRLTQKHRKD